MTPVTSLHSRHQFIFYSLLCERENIEACLKQCYEVIYKKSPTDGLQGATSDEGIGERAAVDYQRVQKLLWSTQRELAKKTRLVENLRKEISEKAATEIREMETINEVQRLEICLQKKETESEIAIKGLKRRIRSISQDLAEKQDECNVITET